MYAIKDSLIYACVLILLITPKLTSTYLLYHCYLFKLKKFFGKHKWCILEFTWKEILMMVVH